MCRNNFGVPFVLIYCIFFGSRDFSSLSSDAHRSKEIEIMNEESSRDWISFKVQFYIISRIYAPFLFFFPESMQIFNVRFERKIKFDLV